VSIHTVSEMVSIERTGMLFKKELNEAIVAPKAVTCAQKHLTSR